MYLYVYIYISIERPIKIQTAPPKKYMSSRALWHYVLPFALLNYLTVNPPIVWTTPNLRYTLQSTCLRQTCSYPYLYLLTDVCIHMYIYNDNAYVYNCVQRASSWHFHIPQVDPNKKGAPTTYPHQRSCPGLPLNLGKWSSNGSWGRAARWGKYCFASKNGGFKQQSHGFYMTL